MRTAILTVIVLLTISLMLFNKGVAQVDTTPITVTTTTIANAHANTIEIPEIVSWVYDYDTGHMIPDPVSPFDCDSYVTITTIEFYSDGNSIITTIR